MALEIGNRKCEVRTNLDAEAGGDPTFELKRMQGSEKLSSLFELSLDLVSREADVDYEQIVGMDISLKMPLRDRGTRHFHGVVARLEKLGRYGDEELARTAYHIVVVPWLWKLRLTHDCRAFENKTVKQITEEIFQKYEYGDFEFPSGYEGEPMDYCVQYRESDFAFLSRLFEYWGLGYTFRHDEEKHQLVIFERSPGLNEVLGEDLTAQFEGKDGEGGAGTIQEFADRQDLPPAYYELLDFRFKDPDYEYKSWDWASRSMADINYEHFDYPGGYVTELEQKTEKRGQKIAAFRREAREASARRLEGRGVSTEFAAGRHFKLESHPRQDEQTRLLLTEVDHVIEQAVGSERDPTIYSNTFACLPEDVPFRPGPSVPKPRIVGTQTAVVVGPKAGAEDETEEIHTDKYGRVRIRFHWNRHVTPERKDLCWARVQQSLAGPKFGTQFLPRIGEEVVVSFLEGDPDQPVVVGALYNGKNLPPYDLPDNKTQSGWKTRSSKEGTASNFNEIRFEDKKDEEELAIHAEKNRTDKVKNNMSSSVGGKQSVTVTKDATLTVKEGLRKVEVTKGNYELTTGAAEVKLDASTNFDAKAGALAKMYVGDNHVKIDTSSIEGSATGKVTMKVGGSEIVIEGSKITIKAGSGEIVLDASGVQVSGNVIKSGATGNNEITGALVKIN